MLISQLKCDYFPGKKNARIDSFRRADCGRHCPLHFQLSQSVQLFTTN